mgnify:CR=1 FL=1
MNLKDHIRSIKDYPKKGILFRDITTLIKNEKAFTKCIDEIVDRSKKFEFNKIAAIESRGFIFASVVSYLLKKPFILLRKKGKLPWPVEGSIIKNSGIGDKDGVKERNLFVEIKTKKGEHVKVVFDGIVAVIDYMPIYNTYIIIDHGDGYATL